MESPTSDSATQNQDTHAPLSDPVSQGNESSNTQQAGSSEKSKVLSDPLNPNNFIVNVQKPVSLFSSMSQTCSIKLDRGNYKLWHTMILPLIKGNKLDGHIDEPVSKPQEFIMEGTEIRPNLEYAEWCTTDQLLLGWLFNTMSLEVASQMTHCTTAKDLWKAAKDLVGAHNKSKITLLKCEFQKTRKGGMKMEEYLDKMRDLADKLGMAGSPVTTEDLVMQTLTGLDIEYNPIVVQLTDKVDLSWIDLQATLLTFEARLEQLNQLSNLSIQPSANAVFQKQEGNRNYFEPNRGGWRNMGQRNARGGRGRGGRNYRMNNRPVCQLCNKTGHTVVTCFFRFDKSFASSPSNNNRGHQSNFNDNTQMTANFATPSVVADQAWYMDSGTNTHVIHNARNLESINDNSGKAYITIANGSKSEVRAVGNTTFEKNQKQYQLNDVHFIPEAPKNLMSVYRFTADNNVRIELDSDGYLVKDKATGHTLVQGKVKQGMYPIKQDSTGRKVDGQLCQPELNVFSTEVSKDSNEMLVVNEKENWHRKLGHPSDRVLFQVLNICNLPIGKNNEKSYFCEACQLGKSHLLPFKSSVSQAMHPLDLIHTDVWGPSPINSTSGHRYYIVFIDDYSRYSWLFPLKHKGDAVTAFNQFKPQVENYFNRKSQSCAK